MPLSTPSILLHHRAPRVSVRVLRGHVGAHLSLPSGRTAVGLCGVPQRRWRGVIRFLESFSRGEDADMNERPAGVPVPQFIRYCIDDLKAFYYEARLAQRPNISEPELHRWFWGETAVAQLIRAVSQRMSASDDPALKYFAYGLAR